MWRRDYTQLAEVNTPAFEQWAGLRWEGHNCGQEKEVWGPPCKEQKQRTGLSERWGKARVGTVLGSWAGRRAL